MTRWLSVPAPLDGWGRMGHFASIRTYMVRLTYVWGLARMLRLSKLTDYAVVVLVRLNSGAQVQTSLVSRPPPAFPNQPWRRC